METIKKNLALIVSGLFLATLAIASSAGVFAAAVPDMPAPTDCPDCQTIQDNLTTAYADYDALVMQNGDYRSQLEGLLERATTNVYEGDPLLMIDNLQSEVAVGHLLSGSACEDPSNSFAYFSSFTYDTTIYCLEGADMWYGVDPDYFNFFDHMMFLNEAWDPAAIADWQNIWDNWIEVLYDHDGDGILGIDEMIQLINDLIAAMEDCELNNCAEPICPDCETIANDLADALDYMDVLEMAANIIDSQLADIEAEIDTVLDQLQQWDDLRAEFEAMVEDAGGMHGADCDNFQVQSGQAWGIAHNFGNVQWCFTDEGQIQDMIQNLDEYWQNNSSTHLPSEADLNQQLDDLMNDYFDALSQLDAALQAIEDQNTVIDGLIADLDACLAELSALQDQGYCLDQDLAGMESLLTDATADVDAGYEPTEPAPEATPEEGPGDIGGHWAEDFLQGLFDSDVMTGDGDTGNMRPNDPLNRAEAAKLMVLSNDEFPAESFFDVFFDVTEDDWFWPFVVTAQDLGYFEGYPDGSFGPANSILRAEAVAVVLRALGFNVPEYDTYSYTDITGDEWFANSAEKAYQCGLVQGRDGAFAGGETITRAEISKILWLAFFEDLSETDCADFECPDCDAIWAEVEALSGELDALGADVEAIWDQMQALEELRDAFRQMVEDAGGMTDAACDGFQVQSGQAWGIAHTFGDVQFCLTSESQIRALSENLNEYWQNNSNQHLPSEAQLNADMDAATQAYMDKLDEYTAKLAEYDDCLAELADLQAQGYCLDQ